jgi:predicted kinase
MAHRNGVYKDKHGTWWARVNGQRQTLNTQKATWELYHDMQAVAERAAIARGDEGAPRLQGHEIIILRGVPGCGKTTWARAYISERYWYKRIGRDDLRKMLDFGEYSAHNEKFIRQVRDRLIRECLQDGYSVIIDDTNLKNRDIREIGRAAFIYSHVIGVQRDVAVPIRIIDFDTPLEECIQRDALRERPVGAERIREMHNEFHGVVSENMMERMRVAVESVDALLRC